MAQTLDNGVIVPVNSDAYNLCPDLQTMGNAVKGVTPVANQAARDALTTFNGRVVWRQDLLQFEVYDGSTWLVEDALEQSSDVSTFSTGWTATNSAEHKPRLLRTGSMIFLVGGVQSSASATSSVLTVPTAYRPPSVGTRFIGSCITSLGTFCTFAMANGVVSIPAGYGNVVVTNTAHYPLNCFWKMD